MASILRNFRNIKWELLVYFIAAAQVAVVVFFVLWYYFSSTIPALYLWALIWIAVTLLVTMIGFVAALEFQRKVSRLHLGILQLGRGNLTERIVNAGSDSFDKIYYDFNDMASSME